LQLPGADFSCFWAGAKTALASPHKLYDFRAITILQGWPLGPHNLRPYIYPPSALFVFMPFVLAPYWVSYGLWVAVTGGLFWVAGRKLGAAWWFMLLPSVALVAYCGQVTFLVGGLTLLGLSLRHRPGLAGVLLGVAAAVKPQLLILAPVALIALGDWKTLLAAAAAGAVLCLASLAVWGAQTWLDWLSALSQFQRLIFDNPALVADAVTPYAGLTAAGLNGAWAFLLAPAAIGWVWLTFRRQTSLADRSIALLGGALLISPYAMNYELALFAPAMAVYLSRRRDRGWLAYLAASLAYISGVPMIALLAVIALPLIRMILDHRAARLGAAASAATAI
jgi:hypothetical protein